MESFQKRYELFAKRTGKPVSFWKKHDHDTIYTAEKALEVGLIDKILWPKKKFPKAKA